MPPRRALRILTSSTCLLLGMLEVQARDLSVPLIDTASVLEQTARASFEERGRQNVFTKNVHLRDTGANLLALNLSKDLIERGLVPLP